MRRDNPVWRVLRIAILLGLALGSANCVPKNMSFGPTPEPVVIRLASQRQIPQIKSLVEDFQAKNPSITVQLVEIQRGSQQQLDALFRENRIDVLRSDRSALRYAQEGLLRSLDELMMDEWVAIRNDYYKGTWEALSIKGQQWGIPAGLDLYVTFVNMDQLQALKLKPPEATWGLNEFVQLALKMNYPEGLPHAPSAKLLGYCTSPENVIDPIVFIYLHGGRIVDNLEAPTQAMLNSPATVEAVQWYADLFSRHQVSLKPDAMRAGFPRGGLWEASTRGNCGIWMAWYSNRGGQDTGYKWSFEARILPLPRDRAEFGIGDLDGYYISKACPHPREALRLVRFLSERWESAGARLPPRKALLNDANYARAVGESTANVAKTFSDKVLIVPYATGPALERVGGILMEALKTIINEDQSAAAILDIAQKQAQAAFEK